MSRHFMREANALSARLRANMDKFYDTNAPGIRFIHGFGETTALACSVLLTEPVKGLQCVEHPLTEQRETGSPIALSFDELELIDLSFHLSIGIDQREPGQDFFLIALQSSSETLHIAEVALFHLLHPVTEPISFTPAHDLSK
jgi:hypothetical protein